MAAAPPPAGVRKSNLPGAAGATSRRTFYAREGTHPWSIERPPVDVRKLAIAESAAQPAAVPPPPDEESSDDEGLALLKPTRGFRRVDTAALFVKAYGTVEKVQEKVAENEAFDMPTLTARTRHNYDYMKRAWHEYFTAALGSSKRAWFTLQPGQALPTEGMMKTFFEFSGTMRGRNGKGLAYTTLVKMRGAIYGMLSACQVQTPDSGYREAITNFIDKLAKQLGVIEDRMRERLIMRPCDQNDFLKAALDPATGIQFQESRVVMYLLATLMSEHGTRIGTWVECHTAQGLALVTRWGDVDIYVTGVSEWGLEFHALFHFRYMKNQKDDIRRSCNPTSRTLPASLAHIDPLLPLIALGCHHDVWVESEQVLQWISGETKPPAGGHIKLTVRDKFMNTGIMRAAKQTEGRVYVNEYQYEKVTRDEQMWKTMSISAAEHLLQKIAKAAGFRNFFPKVWRYAFSERGKLVLPPEVLNAMLGHRCDSDLSWTTYKAAIMPIDVGAVMHGHEQDTSVILFHTSVARDRLPVTSAHEAQIKKAFQDEGVEHLARRLAALDTQVQAKHGKYTEELIVLDKPPEDPVLEDAVDAMNELVAALTKVNLAVSRLPFFPQDALALERIMALFMSEHPFQPLMIADGGRRARANIVAAFTHMLKLDALGLHRQCNFCMLEPESKFHKRDLGGNYHQHMWTCTESHYAAQYIRCPFCGVFQERDDDMATYTEHIAECYVELITELNVGAQLAADNGLKPGTALTKHVLCPSGDYQRTVYYCPICLDDAPDWESATTSELSPIYLIRHMLWHCRKKMSAAVFDLERQFHCRIFSCVAQATATGDDPSYTSAEMIEHWHNVHGYHLLKCVHPEHADDCQHDTLSLTDTITLSADVPYAKEHKILYESDVVLLRELMRTGKYAGQPAADVAYVCLEESCRQTKGAAKKRAQQNIRDAVKL
ncbi:hypothetical protein EV121DRAFT_204241 [Schizophyllum commune]